MESSIKNKDADGILALEGNIFEVDVSEQAAEMRGRQFLSRFLASSRVSMGEPAQF
jgi:hypothetical protein